MTERDPNFTPSQEHQRLLRRSLGQVTPQFLARFGKTHAIQRVKPNCGAQNAADPENSIPSGAPSSLTSNPTKRTTPAPEMNRPPLHAQDFGRHP